MKQLSRKKIQDMIDLNGANISSRHSSGGSGAGGGGGVSSAWVDEHYVSKDFFARLFTINGTDENDDDVVVEPNDLDTDITNIQAMVGLWTEEYLSALGQGSGGGGGGGTILTEPLATINTSGLGNPPSANQVLVWTGSAWAYRPYTTGSGTVTSVALSVPTGFKVSGGTSQAITSSGTFALAFDTGYSLPTTAKQTNWDTAYTWVNTNGASTVSKTAWGRTYWNEGAPQNISGDIENAANIQIDNDKKISWKQASASNYLSMLTLNSSNNFIVGESMANSGFTTYLRGRSINFQTGTGSSGTHAASMSDAGLFTVETLTIYDSAARFTYNSGDATLKIYPISSTYDYETVGMQTNIDGRDPETATGTYDPSGTIQSRCVLALQPRGGYVGIGTSSPSYKLHVNGYTKTSRLYLSDSVYLEYDSTNSGVHLVGAGLYADTYLSALGAGSGGGGGSTTLTEPLASINEAGMGTPSSPNQVLAWDGVHWTYKPYNTGNGTVTSIKITVPTGFNVTPSTITTAGTFAITFASGYSLPTTAKQTNWDNAYTWVNTNGATVLSNSHTHSNKTVLDGISSTKVSNWDTAYTWVNTNGASTVSKTAWGRTYWNAGAPANIDGDIENAANIKIDNNKRMSWKKSGATNYLSMLILDSDNHFIVGESMASEGLATYVRGRSINFQTGTGSSGTHAASMSDAGLFTVETLTIYDSAARFTYNSGDATLKIYPKSGTYGDETVCMQTNIDGRDPETATGTYDPSGTIQSRCVLALQPRGGYVGIGTSSPSYKLHVNGYTKTSRLYLSDSVYLVYDSSNSGVHLVGAGLYADTYISALGAGSGGGSGSGITMNDVWTAMAMSAPNESSQQINVSHLAQALSNYVTLNSSQRIYGTKEFYNANIKSNFGAKFGGLRINFNTSELPAEGEINRSSGSGVCIQYDNAYNVDLCHGGGSVKMQDTLSFSKSGTDHTMSAPKKLTVSAGQLYVSASMFDGNVPYLGGSDIRLKDVINPVTASVEDIANVRIFDFRWKKDGENGNIHFGSAAQDWQTIFPHAVVADKEGFLSMDYAGIAVGAVKTVAQEVVLLKKRVAELEKQLKAS